MEYNKNISNYNFVMFNSSREGDILVNPKTRGVVASPYKAIDTPISHIWA
jgi:hypothetical protein